MKRIALICSIIIVASLIFLFAYRTPHGLTPDEGITSSQAHLATLDFAVREYAETYQKLPAAGTNFVHQLYSEGILIRHFTDPWGSEYALEISDGGSNLVIRCAGPDMLYNTADDDENQVELNPNQKLNPTVKTPVESVNEQGTAGQL